MPFGTVKNPKNSRLYVRFRIEEKRKLAGEAKKAGLTMSEYVRRRALGLVVKSRVSEQAINELRAWGLAEISRAERSQERTEISRSVGSASHLDKAPRQRGIAAMLAPISGTRKDGRSSFRALKDYLEQEVDCETGEIRARGEMILSDNLLSLETAAAEMRGVANKNARVEDPVYHYHLCWQPGERPTQRQWESLRRKPSNSWDSGNTNTFWGLTQILSTFTCM